jgi:hypothetical protein
VGGRRYRNWYEGQGFLCVPAADYVFDAPGFRDCPKDFDEYVWEKNFVDFHIAGQR